MSKRSIYLEGAVTSISMEDAFWHELDRYASTRGVGWADIVRDWLQRATPSDNRSASIKETILNLLRQEVDRLQIRYSGVRSQWRIAPSKGAEPALWNTEGVRLIIGREPPADIVIPDEEVSRRHAMLVSDNERWWLVDLNSKNGTYLRSKRIQMMELAIGTEFSVGRARITLMRSDATI
jgi:predicted DNA-binding ribbon-helix-helix protein